MIIIILILIVGLLVRHCCIRFKQNKKIKMNNLINHQLFSDLILFSSETAFKLSMKNKGKELVLKEILTSKFDCWKNVIFELNVEVMRNLNKDKHWLLTTNLAYLNDGVERFSLFFDSKKYTEEEKEILKIAVDSFNSWHLPHFSFMKSSILFICSLDLDIVMLQYMINSFYLIVFQHTFDEMYGSLNSIVPELTGKTFKGQKI